MNNIDQLIQFVEEQDYSIKQLDELAEKINLLSLIIEFKNTKKELIIFFENIIKWINSQSVKENIINLEQMKELLVFSKKFKLFQINNKSKSF